MTIVTQEIPAGYKQTENGIIPKDWKVMPLKDIAKFRRGSFPQPYGLSKWYDDTAGTPFIQVFDVDENMMLKSETKRRISTKAQEMSVFVKKGSMVLTIQGSIGRVAITQYDAYVDRTLLLFESFLTPVDIYYFAYAIFILFEREKERAPGGTIKTITKEKLSEFLLPLPLEYEQHAIAKALSDADALIESLVKLIAKKRAIKQGAMQELLNGKRRLPGFSGKWEAKLLPDVLKFIGGKAHEQFIEEYGSYVVVNSKFISSEGTIRKYSNYNFCPASEGDILMVMSDLPNGRALAKCFLVDRSDLYAVNQRVCILRAKKDHPGFLFRVLNRNPYFLRFDDGVQQTHLLNKVFLSCPIIVPPSIEEQIAISTILSDIDFELTVLEQKLAKYTELKQGMIQVLMTGKIRLLTK